MSLCIHGACRWLHLYVIEYFTIFGPSEYGLRYNTWLCGPCIQNSIPDRLVQTYMVRQKTLLKRKRVIFLTLKFLPLALALIKTKIHYLLGRKMPILHEKLEFWKTRDNFFSLNKRDLWLMTNGSKRWRFFVLINARANGKGLKVTYLLKKCTVLLKNPLGYDIYFWKRFSTL